MNWTRGEVAALLKEHGVLLRKSLGQNYLVDRNFLDALVRDSGVAADDTVVEIGSGLGNLTSRLAAVARHVHAFEIDPPIHGLSRELLTGVGNVDLHLVDGADFARHVEPTAPLRIVSNLPYGDWQRLVLAILEAPNPLLSCTLMIQTDVYHRLRAESGTREFGPMPALVQSTCSLRRLRKAGKGLFLPPPRVDSVVFALDRPSPVPEASRLESALRGLFAGRRKKSAAAGGRRMEQLSPADLLALARDHIAK